MLTGILTLFLLMSASLGGGLFLLTLFRVSRDGDRLVYNASALVLGLGLIGWFGFFLLFLGFTGPFAHCSLLLVLSSGLLTLRTSGISLCFKGSLIAKALLVFIGLVFLLDVAVAVAPPIDTDSLAYHFAVPKIFLREGGLFFIPRAVSTASPMLQQITFTSAYILGGELGMTLWASLSNWSVALLLFAIARPYIGTTWALALVACFLSTPATIYGIGSGQSEVRNAGFVLAAAYWAGKAVRTGAPSAAAISGIAAGFFAASKYTGLVGLGAVGLAVLLVRRRFTPAFVLGTFAVLAGFQWYVWNWWHTGDPLFPTLFGLIDYAPGVPWNAAQHAHYKAYFPKSEQLYPSNPLWAALYPFLITLVPRHELDALRTGLGPAALAILPLSLAGAWTARHKILKSDLFVYVVVCILFYGVWYLFGPSQRVRHFLPIFGLVLLVLMTSAVHFCQDRKAFSKLLASALSVVLLIYGGGNFLFSWKALQWIESSESREAFVRTYVPGFNVAQWVNKHLTPASRLLLDNRDTLYHYNVPYLYAHPDFQAEVDIRHGTIETDKLWKQLQENRITHLLTTKGDELDSHMQELVRKGCAGPLKDFPINRMPSRTLRGYKENTYIWALYELRPERCTARTTIAK